MEQILNAESFVVVLLVCFAAGGLISWMADIFVGSALGLVADTALATMGALLTSEIFPELGLTLASGLFGVIAAAAIGAIAMVIALRLLQRAVF